MIKTFSDRIHPHHYEYARLGGSDTKEGREYGRKHNDEMVWEYRKKMEIFEIRLKLGDNKKIHMIDGTKEF